MWPRFWFCVGLVKGPLEIMGANYGDYDTVRRWSIVPKASHCLAQQTPLHRLSLFLSLPLFLSSGLLWSLQQKVFNAFRCSIWPGSEYFGSKKDMMWIGTSAPIGKGHPEGLSGLYRSILFRKAVQHFEVVGTSSRRKGGFTTKIGKKLWLTTARIHILLYRSANVAVWCRATWALLWKAAMTKGMRVMSPPCVREGVKEACQAV